MKHLMLTVLIGLAALAVAACAPRTTSPTVLSPTEGAAYAAEVDDIVENMIAGFCENDFAKISRDMPDHLDRDYEASMRQFAAEGIIPWGAYQGKTLDHVEDQGTRRVVIYHLVFEKEPNVTLSVMFRSPDSPIIWGNLWTTD